MLSSLNLKQDKNFAFRLSINTLAISVFMLSAFLTMGKTEASETPEVTKNPDGTLIYKFDNGALCHKSPDYSSTIETSGEIGIKQIFSAELSYKDNLTKLKQFKPRAEEFAAVKFDQCFEYGSGRLTLEEYNESINKLEELRAALYQNEMMPSKSSSHDGPTSEDSRQQKCTTEGEINSSGERTANLPCNQGTINLNFQ